MAGDLGNLITAWPEWTSRLINWLLLVEVAPQFSLWSLAAIEQVLSKRVCFAKLPFFRRWLEREGFCGGFILNLRPLVFFRLWALQLQVWNI